MRCLLTSQLVLHACHSLSIKKDVGLPMCHFCSESLYPALCLNFGPLLRCRNGLLYTLNAQVANDKWEDIQAQYRHAAESFRVLEVGSSSPGIPGGVRPGIPTGLRGQEV